MNWKELVEKVLTCPMKFVATATTGLGDDDEVLAVSIIEPDKPGSLRKTFIKRLDDRDKILKSQAYHKITPEQCMSGWTAEEFVAKITDELKDSDLFMYNPSFQVKFLQRAGITLPTTVYNLPLLIKGAEMRMLLFDDEVSSLDKIQEVFTKKAGGCQAFNKLAMAHGLEPTMTELPVEFSCRALLGLWDYFCELPATVQGTFL